VISPNHDGKFTIILTPACRDLVLRNGREQQPSPAAGPRLSDKDITLVRWIVDIVSENDFDSALEPLAAGMFEIEGKGVLRIHLSRLVNHDSIDGRQAAKISCAGHVGIAGILIRLASCLLTVPSACLVLEFLVSRK
jgi:hypothetical protein